MVTGQASFACWRTLSTGGCNGRELFENKSEDKNTVFISHQMSHSMKLPGLERPRTPSRSSDSKSDPDLMRSTRPMAEHHSQRLRQAKGLWHFAVAAIACHAIATNQYGIPKLHGDRDALRREVPASWPFGTLRWKFQQFLDRSYVSTYCC